MDGQHGHEQHVDEAAEQRRSAGEAQRVDGLPRGRPRVDEAETRKDEADEVEGHAGDDNEVETPGGLEAVDRETARLAGGARARRH